MTWIVE